MSNAPERCRRWARALIPTHNPVVETRMTRILFVGQKPETVDFSDPALPPRFSADKINAGIAVAVQKIEQRGWRGDTCMIGACQCLRRRGADPCLANRGPLARGVVACEAEPGEAREHHGPGRRFWDDSDACHRLADVDRAIHMIRPKREIIEIDREGVRKIPSTTSRARFRRSWPPRP